MWKVEEICISTYDDHNRRVDDVVSIPSWEQLRAFIERLDGERFTDMSVQGPNRYVMSIGGGGDRFVLSVIGDDMGPYELMGPDQSDEVVKIVVGGVLSNSSRRYIAQLEQVLQAAEYFYHHGKIDPGLNWHLC